MEPDSCLTTVMWSPRQFRWGLICWLWTRGTQKSSSPTSVVKRCSTSLDISIAGTSSTSVIWTKWRLVDGQMYSPLSRPCQTRGGVRSVIDYPWWRFERTRPEMQQALRGFTRFLMHPFTSSHLAFAFVPSTTVVPTPHIVIAAEEFSSFRGSAVSDS